MAMKKKRVSEKLRYLFEGASVKRALNTARSILAGRFGAERPPPPWRLQIEVTNRCNLDCVFCSRHEHDLQLGDLSPELFDRIVELSASVQEVALFGYGEPLVSKAFFELLPRLKSSRITFFTNGMLFDGAMFHRVAELSGGRFAYVVFSIDGGTAETFERIRRRASFDTVWKNLREVAAARDSLPRRVGIHMEFVAMRSNVRELPALLEMAEAAGVDVVKVSHLVVWDEDLRDESLCYHRELGDTAFAAAAKAAAGVRLRLELPKSFGEAQRGDPPCRMPWNYAMVSFEGDVRVCCFAPELTMGSLKDNTFREIWHSDSYRALRRNMNENRYPAPCGACEERYRLAASPDEEQTYVKLKPRKK
ncbi:MAG: radical SAM protein [Planctomycetota bacterium]|jgi:radical SAM protein with 4Fe4S-binding SPASM domain|nr:radical SAM protein [Planctomycetota bacterium]